VRNSHEVARSEASQPAHAPVALAVLADPVTLHVPVSLVNELERGYEALYLCQPGSVTQSKKLLLKCW